MKMFVKVYVCVCALARARSAPSHERPRSSLPLTFTRCDAFWNSIKNECVWHKMSEEKEVRENERKTITSQCLFKYLTTWCIVQCSTFYCLCFSFSLSLVWFPSLYIQDWEWIHQYIGHSCKQTSLFDIRRLLSFFSLTLSPVLVRIVCLRQWLFFHFAESV